jgi:hypothetical protein
MTLFIIESPKQSHKEEFSSLCDMRISNLNPSVACFIFVFFVFTGSMGIGNGGFMHWVLRYGLGDAEMV